MSTMTHCDLVFYVNGKKVIEPKPDPETTLLTYLRTKLGLTGTKLGCGEGGCGACTVMVSKYIPTTKKIKHFSANACLAPICSLHGQAVTTVEGIGSIKNGLHPIQETIAKYHGSQCGFCTPGIVMSMYCLLRNKPKPDMAELNRAFEGNLCRCTGYRPIIEGFKTFTKQFCAMGENCCRNKNENNCSENPQRSPVCSNGLVNGTLNGEGCEFLPDDPSQDPIFPPELQTDKFDKDKLKFTGERSVWVRPNSLGELLSFKEDNPNARLVIGNSEVGVEIKLKNMHYPLMLAPTNIPELRQISVESDGVKFGASVTLAEIEETLLDVMEQYPKHQTRIFAAIVEMFRWFAGHQIRNVAAVGGNIMTASPISDLNPLFLAAGALLEVQSKNGAPRTIKMDSNFFLGYRKTAIKPEEVLVSIKLPFTHQDEYFMGYKQAYRREDDIATVNSGLRVLFEKDTNIIKEFSAAYGGMAPITVMPTKTMSSVVGRQWDDSLVPDMIKLLADDLPLAADAPGGMVEYRRTLTLSFFFKFFLSVKVELENKAIQMSSKVPKSFRSATTLFHKDDTKSCQVFEEVPQNQPQKDALGRPLPHASGIKQATGEAIYVDDIPLYSNELYLAFVFSTKAHARITKLDAKKALTYPGVVDFLCYKDITGQNIWGPIKHDEEIFASEKVTCCGQLIGAVVADTQVHAQRAAKAVVVEYEELEPIITIQQAIKAESYFSVKSIKSGNIQKGFEESDHILEGEVHVGGQEHFYLETHATLAVPKNEDGEIELFASTQNPTETQLVVAECLGVDCNKINVRVKRMGGGFGGKETRSVIYSVPVALAASRLGRPVRCMLDRDEDMISSGTRHPFYGKYKVGFKNDGKIMALELNLYGNAGNSFDLSGPVVDRALFHSDNAYKIPNAVVTGYVCKTNIPSNTAFRGFGGPQGMFVAEHWMTEVATYLGISSNQIKELNLYNEGEKTHYNQDIVNCNIKRCWEECLKNSDFVKRRKEVDIFNSENRWKKRGIAMVPSKFGISFTALHMNQAGALVHVYRDGSVLVTHGGTEMGQGLHTKMLQVASRTMGIDIAKIHISETSTNTVPNTSPTAASASSDLNGMAVKLACEAILERLKPVIEKNPDASWEQWINTAYFQRIGLSASGFYRTPDIGYDFETNSGKPFNYFTTGVACSVVEIDCLSGDHQVLRTDIVMDVGTSLNPAIDIGQIEGAFVQGYGLMMMEQQKTSPNGFLFTRGPGAYKIPGFGDIPVEFNVSLLKGASNNRAVYSSKAIGEPPLFLAASVFFAVKDAILSAREDSGFHGIFPLNSPATPERIRMACEDQFTQMFPAPVDDTIKKWFVEL